MLGQCLNCLEECPCGPLPEGPYEPCHACLEKLEFCTEGCSYWEHRVMEFRSIRAWDEWLWNRYRLCYLEL